MIPTTKSLLIVAAVAVGILISGCDPTCTMYVHADRIMAGQVNVLDCGVHNARGGLAAANSFVDCVNGAIQNERPFRGERNFDLPTTAGVRHLVLGRSNAGDFEVWNIAWIESGSTHQRVDALHCSRPGPLTVEQLGDPLVLTVVRLSCPDGGNPPTRPNVYNPPQSVPNGVLCGVAY